VIGQNLLAGLAQSGAILLQARQNRHIAIIHDSAAVAANVPRASWIRPPTLRGRRRNQQKQRNNEKDSGHDANACGL
jgi:hypothetical protein